MARQTGKLKDKAVAKLIQAGVRGSYYDGQGLILKVKSRTTSAWESRYQLNGTTKYFGLGSTDDFTLAEARARNRVLVRQPLADGRDPLAAKQAERAAQRAAEAKAMTFAQACDEFLEQRASLWTNPKHRKQWGATLATYAEPVIGDLPVADIDVPLILKVLEQPVEAGLGYPAGKLWSTRPETAARVRARMESVLDWCKARQLIVGDNPAAKKVIGKVLPARGPQQHHAAMDYKSIPKFMAELRAREGSAARALEFLILAAARSQEVIGARWSEIDLDDGVWTVPAERMKMGREHRVPLSDAMIELLRGLPREGDYIFIGAQVAVRISGGQAGKPMGHSTMAHLLKRMKVDVTVHGFRSSFRDWAGDVTSFAREICEAALAHTKGKVEAAYARGDQFDKRRRLMKAWSKYCAVVISREEVNVGPVVGIGASR
jgi:integrase